MAKYYDKIGFSITQETSPGVWTENIEEKYYSGDLIRNMAKYQSSNGVNDDLTVANEISVISDPYMSKNLSFIRYAIYMGVKWKITHLEVKYPRIILTLGGVYNGQ